ncbi:hypothetical protein GGX14DRAFT_677983 [Mycena pura]|uniref:Uncharacterized protein n=1 Tax=Mycena pura TaxID=153505 RepID=A0AAD6Y070_9AGAR|nr:hypothetical protein GGX14DRAFT_677983 [Mycena pura]
MVTTRKQALQSEAAEAPDNLSKHHAPENSCLKPTDSPSDSESADSDSEPVKKKVKIDSQQEDVGDKEASLSTVRQMGATERGYIYFFFRPKVDNDDPASIDDVKNLHMLLVPRPPKFATADDAQAGTGTASEDDTQDMQLLSQADDAVPARPELDDAEQHYRLLTVGKKTLPDPAAHSGPGRRKESFWATVTAVGDDLDELEKGMGEKTYETKTRGTRRDPRARLAARGCYAIVNNEARIPSQETTYLGYRLSHPAPPALGPVHAALGIHRAGAFVLQVKNPETPGSGATTTAKAVSFPREIMHAVFGQGRRGRDPRGLRFAPCAQPRMLDYAGVELLLVAVRAGEAGLEESLGDGRGDALTEAAETDEELSVGEIFRELWAGEGEIPEVLNGEWI